MAKTPPKREDPYAACPHCTMQVPAAAETCPHCRQQIPRPGKKAMPAKAGAGFLEDIRERLENLSLPDLWTLYRKWVIAAGTLLLALVVLFVVYGTWVGYAVRVEADPALPVKVKKEKRGGSVILGVTVTNDGADVPDLSLRSIVVVVEFLYRDGRVERKKVFPQSENRGEGALLHGESGGFEIEASAKGLREVVLRSSVIDLGAGRTLVAPGGARRYVPGGK